MASLFGQIPATTKRWYLKRLSDAFYLGHPLFWMLTQKKKKKFQGGELAVLPLIISGNAGGSFSAWEDLQAPDGNETDAARYPWASYYGSAAISGQDYFRNKGPEKVLDLFGAKMAGAELTLKDSAATDMCLPSGTANAAGLTSIDEIVEAGTVEIGSLTSTQAAQWHGAEVVAGTPGLSVGGQPIDLISLEKVYMACTEGDVQPDLGATDKISYAKFWTLLQTNQRYLGGDNKVGFKNLIFNDARVYADSHVTSTTAGSFTGNRFYWLNTDYLFLIVHEDVEFMMEEKQPTNQWAYLAYIYWMGQLACNNRRFQGVVHNYTT
jgi:hypothetical protein